MKIKIPSDLHKYNNTSPPNLLYRVGVDSKNHSEMLTTFLETGIIACQFDEDFSEIDRAFNIHYANLAEKRKLDRFNGVNFALETQLPPPFISLEKRSNVVSVLETLLGTNEIGILGSKLLVKDSKFSGSVPLHQDSCYQVGINNITVFVLLTESNTPALKNSVVHGLLGTHRFGHLGDAGTIDRSILEENWPEISFLFPKFTYIFMNPHLWHYSNLSTLGADEVRAMYTFTCHPLSLVSCRVLGDTEFLPKNGLNDNKIFLRSRVSRIIELQSQVDSYTK